MVQIKLVVILANVPLNHRRSSCYISFVDSTKGWLVTDSGLQSEAEISKIFIAATGGTITTSGNFKIHTFTGPGTFTVSVVQVIQQVQIQ